jgi:hypothetical protein
VRIGRYPSRESAARAARALRAHSIEGIVVEAERR